jgi:hypothetical protein
VRLRPALTKLLVVLLLLQWGTAFAHCLRLAAPPDAFAVEICTPEGIHRVVMMPADPDADHDGHGSHATVPPCPACLGPASPALTPPTVALAAPVQLAQAADPPPPPPIPAPAPRPSSCQPRAPPTS